MGLSWAKSPENMPESADTSKHNKDTHLRLASLKKDGKVRVGEKIPNLLSCQKILK